MNEIINVFIADDHAIVREGLRSLISSCPDLFLMGEAADGVEAVSRALQLNPDVILMDLMMPRKNGIEAIEEIKAQRPQIRILVLTSFAEDNQVFSAVRAGALGYMLKEASPQELLDAIHCIYRGESSLHPSVARKLVVKMSQTPQKETDASQLTEREIEVVRLIARGLSNQEIAPLLFVGEGTVRFHVGNILGKLQLENRTQIALYALREGIAAL